MVSDNLKIEIRPIPNRQDIRKLSEKLEYYSQAHIITPYVNPRTRKFVTGLSEEDIKYLKKNNFPYNIDDVYTQGEPHEFWENPLIKVELKNSPMFLYPGKSLLDFVKYKYLLVSNFVYSSESEMQTGSKPQATHYIYNEDVEVEIKSTALAKRNKMLLALANLSLDKKRNLVLIINNENTDNKTDDYLTVKLDEILNSKKKSLLEELLKADDSKINVLSVIKNGVRKSVIRKTPKGYFYYDINIGLTEEDVVEYLKNPENQETLLMIKDKL